MNSSASDVNRLQSGLRFLSVALHPPIWLLDIYLMHPSGTWLGSAYLFWDGSQIGARWKFSFMTGGRLHSDSACIVDWRKHRSNCDHTRRDWRRGKPPRICQPDVQPRAVVTSFQTPAADPVVEFVKDTALSFTDVSLLSPACRLPES